MGAPRELLTLRRRADPFRHELVGDNGEVVDKIGEVVAALDAAGLADGAGQPTARQVLTGRGMKVGNETLRAALRKRRARPPTLPGVSG